MNFTSSFDEPLDYDFLYAIYEEVHEKGGMIHVLSIGLFEHIVHKEIEKKAVKEENVKMLEFIESVQNILFTYEFVRRNTTLKEIKLYKVGMVNFVQKD